jgi:hypothetical protein
MTNPQAAKSFEQPAEECMTITVWGPDNNGNPKATKRPLKCSECGKDHTDPPSKLRPGCQAYKEHQQ